MCSLRATMYWVCAKVNASRGMAMKMPAITDLCACKENDEQTVRHYLHTGGPTPPRPPRLTQVHATHCGSWPSAKTKWWHWQVLKADTTLFTTALRHSSRYPHSESRLHCLSSAQAPHAASRRRNSRGVHCDNERQCMQLAPLLYNYPMRPPKLCGARRERPRPTRLNSHLQSTRHIGSNMMLSFQTKQTQHRAW
jgi:hypothetical protein